MQTSSVLPVQAFRLEIHPTARPQALDLRPRIRETIEEAGQAVPPRLLLLSHHTTAGFPDRSLRARTGGRRDRLLALLEALRSVFPPEAGYAHDRLHLRHELTASQKENEPLNADAHLAFIGAGFTNGIESASWGDDPLWFVDFDGVYRDRAGGLVRRTRQVTVLGFREEVMEARAELEIPLPPDASVVRLDDPALGLKDRIESLAQAAGIVAGRVRLRVPRGLPGVGITVNEFESLLVDRDLTHVLSNPLGFASGGDDALARALEAMEVSGARARRILNRALSAPSPRILRLHREVSLGLLASDPEETASLLRGIYQSPLLLQRRGSPGGQCRLQLLVSRFLG